MGGVWRGVQYVQELFTYQVYIYIPGNSLKLLITAVVYVVCLLLLRMIW